jgi:glutathione S-transferase
VADRDSADPDAHQDPLAGLPAAELERLKRGATINDIAGLAGVSKKTVSRVINRSPFVREETRRRIAALVEALGFAPDPQARGLALRRTLHAAPPRDADARPTITAFERSPDGGKGLARDTRVRWALEEAGQAYDVRLVSFEAMKQAPHLALQPFGQIPTFEQGGLVLFETGAIVLHIAEGRPGLLPADPDARARAIGWMFAAVNTIEPPILELQNALFGEGDKPWTQERIPLVKDRIRTRLRQLADRLGDAEWLDGGFSAADLMMASVLLRLRASGLLDEFPNLAAYVARAEARPAYRRAFAAQLAVNAPG